MGRGVLMFLLSASSTELRARARARTSVMTQAVILPAIGPWLEKTDALPPWALTEHPKLLLT